MYHSPFEYCTVCSEYVALGQTERDCARGHRCDAALCPLRRFFTGIAFGEAAKNVEDELPLTELTLRSS